MAAVIANEAQGVLPCQEINLPIAALDSNISSFSFDLSNLADYEVG